MAFYILAFPQLAEGEAARIEQVRAEHDPLGCARIPAHVTLGFALTGIEPASVLGAVREAAAVTPPFVAYFRSVISMPDTVDGGHLVYLVPQDGFAAFVALRRRLHEGALARFRRPEIPFIPHLTLSGRLDADAADALAARLDEAALTGAGMIAELAVVAREGDQVRLVEQIPLGDQDLDS
jgi:2'-5' RNA ligase